MQVEVGGWLPQTVQDWVQWFFYGSFTVRAVLCGDFFFLQGRENGGLGPLSMRKGTGLDGDAFVRQICPKLQSTLVKLVLHNCIYRQPRPLYLVLFRLLCSERLPVLLDENGMLLYCFL